MAEEATLKVLSLNCWAIPYVSKDRAARLDAIADKLITGDFDIVCLQEIWSVMDFRLLKSKTQEQLPHAHYFHSGVMGSGVCVLSRHPILDVMFHKWSLNGYVHKIHHADWFGGKGVGLCKIKVQDMNINVYIAHLHAEYDKENDEYTAHRVLQAFDTAQFIRMTRGGADAVILGGDLNTEPQDLAYRLICGVAGLQDTCSNSSNNLGTNECANNSYTNSSLTRKFPDGKRIDYILYLGSSKFTVQVLEFLQPFPERIPQKNFSYSDHEAISAHLKISKGEHSFTTSDVRESLKEAINICDLALKSVRKQRIWYLIFSLMLVIPLMYSMGLEYSTTTIGLSIGINIGRLLGTAILCYSLFMSSIWNSVEQNALKAGYSAMGIHLTQLINNYNGK